MGGMRLVLLAAALAWGCTVQAQIAFRAGASAANGGPAPVFVASASTLVNSTSVTVARPAGVQENDLLVAQITVKRVRPVSPPAGWTLINQTSSSTTGDEVTQAVYWRRVGVIGSEPASYAWSWTGSDRGTGAISAYRNVEPVLDPIDAAGVQGTPLSTTITLPTITTTMPNTMLVALLASSRATNAHGVPTGMTTERYEITSGAGPNGVTASMDEQLLATGGSSGAKTATTANADDNIAVLIALRPASPLTIPVPAGTLAGDVMLATVAVRPCSTTSGAGCTLTTAPFQPGWNAVATVDQASGGSFGNRLHIYWRLATAADEVAGAAYTWTFAGAPAHTGASGGILSFSGVDPANPIVAQAGQSTGSGTAHTAPSIDTGVLTNTMLVSSHAASASGTWTAPAGMTEQVDIASLVVPNANGISLEVNTELYAPAGATGARTATFSASDTGTAHLLALRPAAVLDHFNISHTATGVACDLHTITITAHDAAHAAVDAQGATINLSTSHSRGTWTGIVAGGGVLSDPTAGDGAATYTFAPGSTQVLLSFRYANLAASSETFSFNVVSGAVSEASGSANVSDDPSFTMAQAGFLFSNVPTQLSGKPSNVGFNSSTLRIQAVRTDTSTGACVGLFASQSRAVDLGGECNNPTACAGQPLTVNGVAVATSNNNGGTGASAYTGVSLSFNASSQADVVISYPAAGQMSLHARYDLDTDVVGYEMMGASNLFVVRPFGLRVSGVTTSAAPAPTEPVFARAGADFDATITAVQWKAGDDADADGVPDSDAQISGNAAALNFGLEAVPATATLSHALNAPGGGNAGALGGNTSFSNFVNATRTQSVNWSEVGFIDLFATSSNYLGVGNVTNSAAGLTGVGRFRADHFRVTAGTLTNRLATACASSFTYLDEGIGLTYTLQARNTANSVTQNYTTASGYARLDLTDLTQLGLGAVGVDPTATSIDLTARVVTSLAGAGTFVAGQAVNATATVPISRATPSTVDGPFSNVRIGIAPLDADAVALRAADMDLDVDGAGGNDHVQVGGATLLRFGRLRLQNALGSEKLDLPIPIRAEYWTGKAFATNTDDDCTSFTPKNFVLSNWQGGVTAANMATPTAASDGNVSLPAATLVDGAGSVTLLKPSPAIAVPGSVTVCVDLGVSDATCAAVTPAAKSYLQGRNAGPDYDDDPRATGAFGLYGSQPNNFIYFRENF